MKFFFLALFAAYNIFFESWNLKVEDRSFDRQEEEILEEPAETEDEVEK